MDQQINDDADTEKLLLLLMMGTLVMLMKIQHSKRWINRRFRTRPINEERDEQGDYLNLLQKIKNDADMFFLYTRMTLPVFNKLLQLITPFLTKQNWRALPAEQRLFITLRYLATGDAVSSIALAHRIGISTAYSVIKETCTVLVNVLSPIYLRNPTDEEWFNIADGFWSRWNFPHCLGAIDGKHIQIVAPVDSGSLYFNYKKFFSIVLLGMCDHKYKFTLIDTGAYGRSHDCAVYEQSAIGKGIKDGSLNIPRGSSKLNGSDQEAPYFMVGDEAFQLSKHMMRPYPGRQLSADKSIFNYRLSRARRCIENAFGILVARWRIFTHPIGLNPDCVDAIVWGCCCLHNFLMTENENHCRQESPSRTYCPQNFVDTEDENGTVRPGLWRAEPSNQLVNLPPTSAHRAKQDAYKHRDNLKNYFMTSEGEVPWQYDYIRQGFNSDNVP